jgi:hypothetical protein
MISIGDLVRVLGSGSGFIKDGETGTVIALGSSYTGPCKRVTRGHLRTFGPEARPYHHKSAMLPVTGLPPQANQQVSGLCPVLEPHRSSAHLPREMEERND